jgi:hypothetical protein
MPLEIKTALRAIGCGAAVEAALVILAIGGIGPCGPSSPLSAFALYIHTPGLTLANAIGIREPASFLLVAGGYASIWSAIAKGILSLRSRRKS